MNTYLCKMQGAILVIYIDKGKSDICFSFSHLQLIYICELDVISNKTFLYFQKYSRRW